MHRSLIAAAGPSVFRLDQLVSFFHASMPSWSSHTSGSRCMMKSPWHTISTWPRMSLDKTFGGHWVLRSVSDCCINSWSILSKGKAILKLKLCTKTVAAGYGNRWKFLYSFYYKYQTLTPNETPECNMNVQRHKKKAIVTNQAQSNKKTH